METEILSDEELVEITGYKTRAGQRRWLIKNDWKFVESRGGRPLVGRQYLRARLGDTVAIVQVTPPLLPTPAWTPDFSRVH
ncbi:DUF4224 domain-containing protein [Pseudomonas putida]|uniref:DUF4224 domain-containing protein n=1 Tax=Pseudomonas putida TaxID=303 RepID=A0A1Q9R368_PSEPU|nr:DUF4224 domain-containing protein [Pseudomonas putida]OLS61843.1 hypothetical protein PSEMO_32160 [Pseudomonas putida]